MRALVALLWAVSLGSITYVTMQSTGLPEQYFRMAVTTVSVIAFVSVYVERWKVLTFAAVLPIAHGLATLFEISLGKAEVRDLILVFILDAVAIVILILPTLILGRQFHEKY